MKKVITVICIMLCLVGTSVAYAENTATVTNQNTVTGKLIEIKEKELNTLEDYKEAYGSDAYGLTAYLLNRIRIYSIPFGFVAIVIAAIYQYIIGIKKLDVRDKGFGLMIASVTIIIVFAIVVKGWRS